MEGFRLRGAREGDAAAIGALHVASWRETYRGILPGATLAALSAEARAAMWRSVLADPESHGGATLFVAEEAGAMIGFGACAAQRDTALAAAGFGGEIGAIYVLRARQGQGLGCALMAALADALTNRGHRGATLWVLRENAPARAFYERLGGEIVSKRTEEADGKALVEIAYGWRDLSGIARGSGSGQRASRAD